MRAPRGEVATLGADETGWVSLFGSAQYSSRVGASIVGAAIPSRSERELLVATQGAGQSLGRPDIGQREVLVDLHHAAPLPHDLSSDEDILLSERARSKRPMARRKA